VIRGAEWAASERVRRVSGLPLERRGRFHGFPLKHHSPTHVPTAKVPTRRIPRPVETAPADVGEIPVSEGPYELPVEKDCCEDREQRDRHRDHPETDAVKSTTDQWSTAPELCGLAHESVDGLYMGDRRIGAGWGRPGIGAAWERPPPDPRVPSNGVTLLILKWPHAPQTGLGKTCTFAAPPVGSADRDSPTLSPRPRRNLPGACAPGLAGRPCRAQRRD
jgi:hypothetical protein